MEKEQNWLDKEIEGLDNELEYSTDPTRFNISLTDQGGESGGEVSYGGKDLLVSQL